MIPVPLQSNRLGERDRDGAMPDTAPQDTAPEPPEMRPYGRHLFICGHGTCGPAALAPALVTAAREALGSKRRLRNPERIKISIADCLGVCAGGPIGVVYPEG